MSHAQNHALSDSHRPIKNSHQQSSSSPYLLTLFGKPCPFEIIEKISNHMQKTNFSTQLIIEMKLIHCLASLWPSPGLLLLLLLLLWMHNYKQKLNFMPELICELYCSLKNPVFWLGKSFFDNTFLRTSFPPRPVNFDRKTIAKYFQQYTWTGMDLDILTFSQKLSCHFSYFITL